jgi:short-subunit dehydrogenase
MDKRKKFRQYFGEYTVSNNLAMIRNNRKDPRICSDDFHNKWVVITGATSGIGYMTARKYALHGANLLCVNRNPDKSQEVRREIEAEYGVECRFIIADLSRLEDIHRAATALSNLDTPIDVLIHNAGVYLTGRNLTSDGLEKVFVVQYLASFVINLVLMEKLKSQERCRILLVNSEGHRFAAWGLRLDDLNWEKRRYFGLKSYGSAKTAQLLSMIVFDEHFRNTGVTINAMHPGAVKTETGQENGPLYRWYKNNVLDRIFKSPEISAEALYYLGVSEEIKTVSGKFFNLTTEEEPAPPALDKEVAEELWEISLDLSGLRGTRS